MNKVNEEGSDTTACVALGFEGFCYVPRAQQNPGAKRNPIPSAIIYMSLTLTQQKIKKIIENNPLAFSTITKNKKPNVIAVACAKVVSADQVLITDNYMKQTKENLRHNPNVCLAVWDKNWRGYKLIGQAKYYTTGRWKKIIEEMKENKGLPAKGAILIKVTKIISLR